MRIIAVGKIKEHYIAEGIEEFTKRLTRFTKLSIIEVKDEKILKDNTNIQELEGERLLKQIKDDEFVIALDGSGTELSSEEFAATLKRKKERKVVFVIGGALGLGDNIKRRANLVLSLSRMTFPHQLARLIFLEQLYRAFTILGNAEYHK